MLNFSSSLGQFPSPTPLSLICLWYLPIPEVQKGRLVEEYQHWLHIKLMDSLPNSYSIYFPSGIPSVSFPLPLLNFLYSVFHSHSAFFCPCFPSHPFSSSLISFPLFSVPCYDLSTKPHTSSLSLSLDLCCYALSLFLTSSSVVWLTEKCLICRAFLLDSNWSKMSATPPGATGTWYSTIFECWSCVFLKRCTSKRLYNLETKSQ